MRANHVYVGLKGSVLALERESGRILWQRELAGSSFVNLIEEGNHIFALSQGEAYCLDAGTGALLWHNPLKGFWFQASPRATPPPWPKSSLRKRPQRNTRLPLRHIDDLVVRECSSID